MARFYLTDVADTEQVLRLIQSIPSPEARPWGTSLARFGYEPQLEEIENTELTSQANAREVF